MKLNLILIFTLALVVTSCNKNNEQEQEPENYLFTKKWKRPSILHYPANLGFFSTTTCPRYHQYTEDGEYHYEFPSCNSIPANSKFGTWVWIDQDEKLKIEYTGFDPDRYVKIISIDEDFLHTIEFFEEKDEFNENYWEFKYPSQENKLFR